MRDVLLVMPKFEGRYIGIPLGLLYIAACLREKGMGVSVLDLNATPLGRKSFRNFIEREKPDIVGISSTSPSHLMGIQLAKLIKASCPETVVVKGGSHECFLDGKTLEFHPEIDISVIGEGEFTFPELVGVVRNGGALKSVKGIVYRDGGEIVKTEPRPVIHDLDCLPFPARDLLQPAPYYDMGIFEERKHTHILTSRGCGYRCVFCIPSPLRVRSVGNVMDEMKLIREQGYDALFFEDSTFQKSRERTVELMNAMIEEEFDFRWGCMSRANTMDKELLQLMKKAGCSYIMYGAESGEQRVLDALQKDITHEQVRRAFGITKELGIDAVASVIFGGPFDKEDSTEKTIGFLNEIDPDYISICVFAKYPGSSFPLKAHEYERFNSPEEIWKQFDEGHGALHFITAEEAEEIYKKIERGLDPAKIL